MDFRTTPPQEAMPITSSPSKTEPTNYPALSPLRYPGGKSRALKYLVPLLPEGLTEICSPFFGGGNLELYMASKGVRVYGYDLYEPLVTFWESALCSPCLVAQHASSLMPLSQAEFKKLQCQLSDPGYMWESQIERAAAFYAINRSSFSGSTNSGGMSPGHQRFNQAAINKLYQFHAPNVTVEKADYREAIGRHPDVFLYLDPPYILKNSDLYGSKGNTHRDFDHGALFETLLHRGNWLMSYNDSPTIRDLYQGYTILPVTWAYGMNRSKESSEIVILSSDLAQALGLQQGQMAA